jgi:ubiquinone/menaquinone biosynthesis C-methylase UbiE
VTETSGVFDQDVAAHYEAWYETPDGKRADALEKALLGRLLERFQSDGSALEVGCGTGHFTRWLVAQGFRAVGLDLSTPMLAQAQALDGHPLVQGDGYRLPFADSSFDLVAMITTLEFLERPRQALSEALRVGRNGMLLGVLNRCSTLGVQRRLAGLSGETIYDAAHFYGPDELKRLARSVAGEQARIAWRTTLFPRWCPWAEGVLPWGGFIGLALLVDGYGEG